MVTLTGSDFQRINFYCKNLVSSKTSEFFFESERRKPYNNKINNKETEPQITEYPVSSGDKITYAISLCM